ncbi:unnamed protein product [Prorocentrum cordatum]|uniref:Pentatricopeptide repeat-containing protein, chloroplastic n=1 Tax=Prorocentrum cordatum TaxID=2364126 RepID=A0ABN9TAD3_9DINO|nr:unnamed protein product [Polarella glacialis]
MQEAKLEPNVIGHNAVISACKNGGQWQRAVALLSKTREVTAWQADVTSYAAGISACGNGEQWQRALELLSGMRGAKLEPTVIFIYSAGISACEKGRQWQLALVLLGEMREVKLESDGVSCGAGISACEKCGQWQRALALLREICDANGASAICYNAGIIACEKGRQWQRALALLRAMCDAKLEAEVISYSAGVSACEKLRAVAAGSDAAQRDVGGEAGARSRLSYSAGISACEKGSQWQWALALLGEMREAKLVFGVAPEGPGRPAAARAFSETVQGLQKGVHRPTGKRRGPTAALGDELPLRRLLKAPAASERAPERARDCPGGQTAPLDAFNRPAGMGSGTLASIRAGTLDIELREQQASSHGGPTQTAAGAPGAALDGRQKAYVGMREAKELDKQGLALLEELLGLARRGEALGSDPDARHRLAAEEVEPLLRALREVVEDGEAIAQQAHAAAASAASAAPDEEEEVWDTLRIADFIEQDLQLKEDLVGGLTHASSSEEVAAARTLWSTRPWLEHPSLERTGD